MYAGCRNTARLAALLSLSIFAITAAQATQMQFTQQGPKLVGTGYVATAPGQGTSVAISSDGNTIIVGAPGDVDPSTGAEIGAAWVFTRTNGVWTQQGAKLVGTGAPGDARQGTSVALSADGNTAIVGGPADNATTGAAWVFTRTNGVWSQQGAKLVATGAIGLAGRANRFRFPRMATLRSWEVPPTTTSTASEQVPPGFSPGATAHGVRHPSWWAQGPNNKRGMQLRYPVTPAQPPH